MVMHTAERSAGLNKATLTGSRISSVTEVKPQTTTQARGSIYVQFWRLLGRHFGRAVLDKSREV